MLTLSHHSLDLENDPANSTCGNFSEDTRNTNSKEYMHPYVHCNVLHNSQDLEAAQVPIGRWVDKKAMGHLHNRILLGYKNKETLSFVTVWMGLESIKLSEIKSVTEVKRI